MSAVLDRIRFVWQVLRHGPPEEDFLPPGSSPDPNHRAYKGFVSRSVPQEGGRDLAWCNLHYVREDGGESCCGQIDLGRAEFESAVENALRKPLPTWMTHKPPAWSPYSDWDRVRSTCCHGTRLDRSCDACLESYGEARPQHV